ncbi:MAG: prolyl-tRNA synthetase [Planctomycetota bacterium]|jgi:prolyl-tRNA synthetase
MYGRLEAEGIDVAWDERKKVSPGAKFKDADLACIQLCIVVDRDTGERIVERNPRRKKWHRQGYCRTRN